MSRRDQPAGSQVADWATRVIDYLGEDPDRTDVCIRIVDEPESQQLNSRFRQLDRPTNVLSFPAEVALPGSDRKILGDIVVCHAVVQREAAQQSKSLADHYAHMVVHGMLHLYGYDHIDAGDADVMEGVEREILGRIGIGDPYRGKSGEDCTT